MLSKLKEGLKVSLGLDVPGRHIEVFEDDIFIVSYPKSGNTWARFLIGNLLDRKVPTSFSNLEQKIPDIYKCRSRILRRLSRPRILKSHEYFDPRYKKILYLVRDPRDVVISYYHYHLKMGRIEENWPITRYVEDFVKGELDGFGSWRDHVASWLSTRRDHPEFLLVRYEDLVDNTRGELEQIADFIGGNFPKSDLVRAIELSSFEKMRALEAAQKSDWSETKSTRKDKWFVRKGSVGSWKGELPALDAEMIEEQWHDWMEELGYLPNDCHH